MNLFKVFSNKKILEINIDDIVVCIVKIKVENFISNIIFVCFVIVNFVSEKSFLEKI